MCPVPTIKAPTFPKAQFTSHRPRSLEEILLPAAIRKLATELKPIIAVMELHKKGLPVPRELQAQLKTIVIGKGSFVKAARGVVWDLRRRHPDGHFIPLDFDAPLNTHLNTSACSVLLVMAFLTRVFGTRLCGAHCSLQSSSFKLSSVRTCFRLVTHSQPPRRT